MGNFARKIIDAIQNLMLDTLLLRFFPLWWVGSLWQQRQGYKDSEIMVSIMFTVLLLFVIAWALGAVANRRPRRAEGPLERLQTTPSNGFEAWSEFPSGGLRPPAWLRVMVMALGRRSVANSWTVLVGFAVFLAAVATLWALAYSSEAFWIDIHPSLVDESVRDALWIGATTVVILMVFRQWASEQRARLEPTEERRYVHESDWIPFGLLSMLTLATAIFACFVLAWPMWIAAVPAFPLAIVALIPKWRGAIDAWFGKRGEVEASRSNESTAN